jgi:Protein of unknown function (DUF3253)
MAPDLIQETIVRLLNAAGFGHSISPTEVAQELKPGNEWNTLMPAVRRAAVGMALEGRLVIYRKGKPVDPNDFKGVYRLGLPRRD